jgi:hypothetical protein
MPPESTNWFGNLLHELGQRNSALYEHLPTVSAFTQSNITLPFESSETDTSTEDLEKAFTSYKPNDALLELIEKYLERFEPELAYYALQTLLLHAVKLLENPADTSAEEFLDHLQDYLTQYFTYIDTDATISPPMPPKEGESVDPLAEHISDLQSQAKLKSETKQRPSHYPHENVVFHVAQLRTEAKSQEEPPAGSGIIYDRGRLMTLAEASRVSGVKLGTLHNLLSDGKLTERGRIKAPGGGKVLIDLDELDSLPRRPVGRPKKSPERLSSRRPRGRPRKIQPQDSPKSFEVVATLRQAAEQTGVPLEEIMTTRDIQAEWNVNRLRVLRWTWSGQHGEPHLTPLPVRLKGGRGGQLLFRRSDVERTVADPPKGGRPSN